MKMPHELIDDIRKLDTEDRQYVIRELISDERISLTEFIVAKVFSLESFKSNAKRDIVKIAEAGMELGEREMRRVTKIKGNTRKKDDSFYLAMVKVLLDAGAYKSTKFGDEISAADYSSVDTDWYEWAWGLKSTNKEEE